ncbi:hypothetical protein IT575_02000 [bacterium]|nr:hypothetical protein [bacterium]
MKRPVNKLSGIALWVSCLALLVLTASCGGANIGSPIQDDLNAGSEQPQLGEPPFDPALLPAEGETKGEAVEIIEEAVIIEEGKSASYTPGLPVWIPNGISLMNPQAYGWKGGNVKDIAGAPFVKLINAPGIVPQPEAWVRYDIRENQPGRLQTIMIMGTGTKLRVNLYKWNSAAWQNFGLYDLNNGPVMIQVPAEYVQNGHVYLKLREPYLGTSQINSIEVNVF